MIADADIQVWLYTHFSSSQAVIVPYVQSESDARLQYQINMVQRAGGSTSQVSQQGKLDLSAGRAAQLSRLAVGAGKDGRCDLEIVLREHDSEIARFRFDCETRP